MTRDRCPASSGRGTPTADGSDQPPVFGASSAAAAWQPPSIDHLQSQLPHHEILSMLGQGGMGAVYKARQKSLDRLVAIKVLRPPSSGENFVFSERFRTEACLMAKLLHPGIVSVFEFGETSDQQGYLVMEYVDGTGLAEWIQRAGVLPEADALAITAHVCDALEHAHSHGIVHRDINPANILITTSGQVKVVDFGIAGLNDSAQTSDRTEQGIAIGTPGFAAPEALHATHRVDSRADLYAVGVMLYQMLTGRMPAAEFLPPSEATNGHVDHRFDDIVGTAMQVNREVRYQRASEIRRDLDAIAAVPRVPRALVAANPARRPQAAESLVSKGRGTLDRTLCFGVGVFAMSLIATGIARLLSKPGPDEAAPAVQAIPPAPEPAATPPPVKPDPWRQAYLQALAAAFAKAAPEDRPAFEAEMARVGSDHPLPAESDDLQAPAVLKRLRHVLREQLAGER